MITKKHLDALAASKFDLLKSKDIFKNNLENLKIEIESDLDSLSELALPEVYNERFNFFKLDETTTKDFQERILEVEKDRFVMAGIRFKGLNINKPFVSIHANFEISASSFPQLAELVKTEFSIFKPQALQFHMPSGIEINDAALEIDRYTIVGSISKIVKSKLADRSERVEVVELCNTEFYNDYLNEYQIFHKKVPELIDEVKAESLEDFQEAIDNKLLYQILIDGKKAGIIAGSAFDYYGLKGVCILEEILYDTFKGKGLGAYVQKAFAEALEGHYSVLWGTISHLNQPSLKTALRNGRRVEEIEYSFNL